MAQELIRLSSCSKSGPALERRDVPELTPRQLEVLELMASGRSVKEIGKELYLSQAFIRNHVRSLLQALGAHSQLEALAKARKLGLLAEYPLKRCASLLINLDQVNRPLCSSQGCSFILQCKKVKGKEVGDFDEHFPDQDSFGHRRL